MIESEFQALIEVTAPIREWEPTAEDLHRMFWCQPLPTWFDQQEAFATHQAMRNQTATELLTRQASALGLDRNAYAYSRAKVSLNTPAVTPRGRWVVQIYSAGQWYDIDETRTNDEQSTKNYLARHLKVQPHLKLRVIGQ